MNTCTTTQCARISILCLFILTSFVRGSLIFLVFTTGSVAKMVLIAKNLSRRLSEPFFYFLFLHSRADFLPDLFVVFVYPRDFIF